MSHDPSAPPTDFTRAMKGLYHKTRKQQKDVGLWEHVYGHTLELWVRAIFRAREARGTLGEELTVPGSKGQEVAHPLLRVIREAEQDAHRYATDLLMTPASRKAEAKQGAKKGKLGL